MNSDVQETIRLLQEDAKNMSTEGVKLVTQGKELLKSADMKRALAERLTAAYPNFYHETK